MSNFRPFVISTSAMIGVLSFVCCAAAQSSNPAWLDQLEMELAVNHECAIAEHLFVQENEIGGRKSYTAKVKCKDGREFDGHKIEPQEEFTIRLCEIVSC